MDTGFSPKNDIMANSFSHTKFLFGQPTQLEGIYIYIFGMQVKQLSSLNEHRPANLHIQSCQV